MAYAEKRGTGSNTYYRARYRRGPGESDGTVKDADGRTVRFARKRDAEKAGNDAEADYRAGRLLSPSQTAKTVGEWYAEWRPAQHYERINTEQAYDGAWRRHIEPRWGSKPIAEILPIHVQGWETELRARFSASTVTVIMSPFRRMLEDAQSNLRLLYSPLPAPRRRGTRNPRSSKGVAVPLATWEQILGRLEPADALLARIVYWTGMRWSEVSAMRVRFLTLTPRKGEQPAAAVYYLHPDIGAVHEDASGHRHYGPPKSGPGREWDLPPFLAEQLIEHVARLRTPGRDVHPDDKDLLFPDHVGRPHTGANWKRRWRAACDGREGTRYKDAWEPIWPGLRPHDGKHSHAVMLDDLGVHRVMRDYRLGHSDGSARAVYEHPSPDMRRLMLNGLQARWEAWQAEAAEIHSQATPGALFEYADLQVKHY
jgi:integrase